MRVKYLEDVEKGGKDGGVDLDCADDDHYIIYIFITIMIDTSARGPTSFVHVEYSNLDSCPEPRPRAVQIRSRMKQQQIWVYVFL